MLRSIFAPAPERDFSYQFVEMYWVRFPWQLFAGSKSVIMSCWSRVSETLLFYFAAIIGGSGSEGSQILPSSELGMGKLFVWGWAFLNFCQNQNQPLFWTCSFWVSSSAKFIFPVNLKLTFNFRSFGFYIFACVVRGGQCSHGHYRCQCWLVTR